MIIEETGYYDKCPDCGRELRWRVYVTAGDTVTCTFCDVRGSIARLEGELADARAILEVHDAEVFDAALPD